MLKSQQPANKFNPITYHCLGNCFRYRHLVACNCSGALAEQLYVLQTLTQSKTELVSLGGGPSEC